MKKSVGIFFTVFAVYMIWQVSRIDLGFAILLAAVLFAILCWLNCDSTKLDETNSSIRYEKTHELDEIIKNMKK